QSYQLPFGTHLSNRGLILPSPQFGDGFGKTLIAFAIAVLAVILLALWARRRRMATGRSFPTLSLSLAILIGLPLVVFLATGTPLSFSFPELTGFNFVGGAQIKPEFLALLLGLVLYTA